MTTSLCAARRLARQPWCLLLIMMCTLAGCADGGILRPDLRAGCELPLACQTEGVDLAVLPPVILADASQRDPATGYPVFMPGDSLSYVVTVVNRGTTRTLPDTVEPGVIIPALDPGRRFVDTVRVAAPTDLHLHTDSQRISVWLTGRQGDDPLLANDVAYSDPYFIRLPVIRVALEFPDTAREATPFVATYTVRNHSRFVEMPPSRMVFCLIDYDVGCGSWAGAPFHLTDVPAIPAGGSWTRTDTIVIPPINDRDYADWSWNLVACFRGADSQLADFFDWVGRSCVPQHRPLHVKPAPEGGAP